jgi:hypothetical protein
MVREMRVITKSYSIAVYFGYRQFLYLDTSGSIEIIFHFKDLRGNRGDVPWSLIPPAAGCCIIPLLVAEKSIF